MENGHLLVPETVSRSDASVPVVIMLGWAGATEKHILKCTSLYTAKGFICFWEIARLADIMIFKSNLRLLAERILDVLLDQGLSNHPIFIHAFSNGGARVYDWLSILLQHHPKYTPVRPSVKGVIFDSSPAWETKETASSVVFTVAQSNGWPFPRIWALLFGLYVKVSAWIRTVLGIEQPSIAFWNRMLNCALRCPELFLYSSMDAISSASKIEEVIATHRAHKIHVTAQRWEDVPHVSSLRLHPAEYSAQVDEFVHTCLLPMQRSTL
eukprot:GILJ01005419.1.p1 GENE.GILJ01005419.1~~GILJ01005419.1.p1  ORF type:complete len:268 (-),score=27.08 GILJ01005419.1:302-1105(-)